ncbi:MAG: hypothetical protein NC489_28850 [Ruminococcus flavefaciens]|nr:hypothetical protein [Ruminococcus flavefaciens]
MEDFTSRHEKKIKCFRIHVDKFRDTYNGFTGKEIKTEWIKTAREHYAKGVAYDEVVGLYDTSSFGKGKSGLLFTDNYLYWKRSLSNGIIRLDDIEKITYYDESKKKDTDKGIIFHLKNGSAIEWEGFCSLKCGEFIKFMGEYLKI